MRIDTSGIHLELTEQQREYARTRLWVATRGASDRLTWIGLWLTERSADGPDGIVCRITAWVRGVGPVNVAQAADDPMVAIDMAAVRLERALSRATRVAARSRRAPRRAGAAAARPPRGRAQQVPRKVLKQDVQNDGRGRNAQIA